MSTGAQFIERLLYVVPELKRVYDEHLTDNDVLLPHVLMGDVTRLVISEISDSDGLFIISRIFDYFEKELLEGDMESLELIRSSFVENLLGERTAISKLKPMMGPHLLGEIEVICGLDDPT